MPGGAATSPAVIDLGDISSPPPGGAAGNIEPPTARHRRGWWRPGPPHRYRAGAVVLLVAALSALSAAAPQPPPTVEHRAPADTDAKFWVFDGQLYVGTGQMRATTEDPTLTAYRLTDGRMLWRVPAPSDATPWPASDLGVLLVLSHGVTSLENPAVLALDPESGARRWRVPGGFVGVYRGGAGPPLVLVTPNGPDREQVMAVDARTGARRWIYDPPPHAVVTTGSPGAAAGFLVTGLISGRVEVRDLADLRVVTTLDLPPWNPATLARQWDLGAGPWLTTHEDLALVRDAAGSLVTAYDLPGLRRRWHLTGRFGIDPVPLCGSVLCVDVDGATWAVEPATGRRRWPVRHPVLLHSDGDALLATEFGSSTGEIVILDEETGDERARLRGWLPVDFDGRRSAYVRWDPGRRRMWVAELDATTGRMRTLATVPNRYGSLPDCRAGAGVLVCRATPTELAIWHHR